MLPPKAFSPHKISTFQTPIPLKESVYFQYGVKRFVHVDCRSSNAPVLQLAYATSHGRCRHCILPCPVLFCILMQFHCLSVRHSQPFTRFSIRETRGLKQKTSLSLSPLPKKNSAFRESRFWTIARSASQMGSKYRSFQIF